MSKAHWQEPEQLNLLDWIAAQEPRPVLDCPQPVGASAPAVTSTVRLTRVDPCRNMRRFYSLALVTSLFGEHGVARQWGRIGAQGQRRTDWYVGVPEAERALDKLLRAKQRRDYRVSGPKVPLACRS